MIWTLLGPLSGDFTNNTKPGDGGSKEGSKWAPTWYHFTDNFNTSANMLTKPKLWNFLSLRCLPSLDFKLLYSFPYF
jgi:hypothetical protein